MSNKKKKQRKETNTEKVAKVADRVSELYSQTLVNYSKDFRPKVFSVNFGVLERMAESNPLIQAIITKRCDQLRPFCSVAMEANSRGFKIVPKDGGKGDEERIKELQEFILRTGFIEDEEREDDFSDYCQLLIRDVLTFDQNASELRRDRAGNIVDFWYVDGTTIQRIQQGSEYAKKGYVFAQKNEDDKLVAVFKSRDMVFDYMNKRGRLRHRGYGYSPLEQMIDLVTTFLYSLSYNRDTFVKDKIPRGFLKVNGEVDQKTLNAIRNHWLAEMQGYGARFNIPIVPSGKGGVGIDWQSLTQTNRDMEYHKLVMFIVALTCAVYAIDPAELGLKTDDGQTLVGDSGDKRIQHSRDAGLGSLLSYIETIVNKIIVRVDDKYEFRFVGIKDEDLSKKEDLTKKRLESYMTIDEVREQEGLKPFKQWWSQCVMHTAILQQVAMQQQQQGGGEAPPEGGEAGGEAGGDFGGFGGEEELPQEPVAEVSEDDLMELEPEGAERAQKSFVQQAQEDDIVEINIR